MRIAFFLVAAAVLFFALAGAAFGQVVFTDTFNDGRKPDWKIVSGNWGDVGGRLQATAVTDGSYSRTEEYWKARAASPHGILLGRNFPTYTITLTKVPVTVVFGDEPTDRSIIVVSTLAPTDCTIDMDSTPFIRPPDGPIPHWPNPDGITGSFSQAVLRYTDPQNYILAGYHPGGGGALYIFEVINDNMHPRAFKAKPHFYTAGPLHLKATASGPTVTLTVTDSNGKTDSISGEMTTVLGPGNVGLFHDDGASGFPPTSTYDNFVVSTVAGKGKKTENRFSNFFAKGVFFINENDSMVNRTYIDDPKAAQSYYDRAMKHLAGAGFNLVTVYWTPVDHRKMVLDSAQKYGLEVIVHLPEIASMIQLGHQVNLFDFAEHTTRALRDHPALAGYYIADEPLVKPEVVVRAELARLALEVSDPKHPSLLCLADVDGKYEDVLTTVNVPVLLVDSYPVVSNWSGDFSGYVEQLQRGQRNAGDRPLWIIPQVFGEAKMWKTPTPEEVRAEVWLALAHGAKGFIHFMYQSTTSNGEEWIRGLVDMDLNPIDGRLHELKQLNADLDSLAPTLLSLHAAEFTPPQVSDAVVARAFLDAKGTRYVILANTDVKNPATFVWTGVATTDVLTGKKIRSQISLVPGGGKVMKLQ